MTNSNDTPPPAPKNYITRTGFQTLQKELHTLVEETRPEVVQIVSWAASNGDRSENGDYLYGKKRLREIDRRIRYLTKTLESAQIVDCNLHYGSKQVFFGAHVTYEDESGQEIGVTIVGLDEANPQTNKISWIAPLARALLKKQVGDSVIVQTPMGSEEITILSVVYPET